MYQSENRRASYDAYGGSCASYSPQNDFVLKRLEQVC